MYAPRGSRLAKRAKVTAAHERGGDSCRPLSPLPVAPSVTGVAGASVTPMSPLTLRQAADTLGASVRTLQRRRSELLAAGATHGPSGWSIPETALDALREGATPVTLGVSCMR